MRKLFLALGLLLVSGLAALWLRAHDGYVVLVAGNWRIETSLILFIGAIAAAFILAWMLLGLALRTAKLPGGVRRQLRYRREGRARDRLVNGLLAAAEGRFQEAESTLAKAASEPSVSLLGQMLAADVAQRAGEYNRRDEYMALADQAAAQRGKRDMMLALRLLQAQWYADAGQWEQALAALASLRESHPNHPRVLTLLRDAALALGDWDRLAELLPALRRAGVMADADLQSLERRIAEARMQLVADDGDKLESLRASLPKPVRRHPGVVLAYARTAIGAGRSDLAEPVLRRALGRQWDGELVACYGHLASPAAEAGLKQAEDWLKRHPEDPDLLLAAGRLAAQQELWGRARSYVEAAVSRRERGDALQLLAQLQQRMGEECAALKTRERALTMIS